MVQNVMLLKWSLANVITMLITLEANMEKITPIRMIVLVDSEQSSSPTYTLNNAVQWLNNSGQPIPWINNSIQTVVWLYSSGYALYKSDAQQYGKYLGLTATSTNPNFTYNTFEFEHELRVRF